MYGGLPQRMVHKPLCTQALVFSNPTVGEVFNRILNLKPRDHTSCEHMNLELLQLRYCHYLRLSLKICTLSQVWFIPISATVYCALHALILFLHFVYSPLRPSINHPNSPKLSAQPQLIHNLFEIMGAHQPTATAFDIFRIDCIVGPLLRLISVQSCCSCEEHAQISRDLWRFQKALQGGIGRESNDVWLIVVYLTETQSLRNGSERISRPNHGQIFFKWCHRWSHSNVPYF